MSITLSISLAFPLTSHLLSPRPTMPYLSVSILAIYSIHIQTRVPFSLPAKAKPTHDRVNISIMSANINTSALAQSAGGVLTAKDPNKLLNTPASAPIKPTHHIDPARPQTQIPGLSLGGVAAQSSNNPKSKPQNQNFEPATPPVQGLLVNYYNPDYDFKSWHTPAANANTARLHAVKFRKWTAYENEIWEQTAAYSMTWEETLELLPGRTREDVAEREEKINGMRKRDGLARLEERRESGRSGVDILVVRAIADAARRKQEEVDERKAAEAKAHTEYGEILMKEVDRDIAARKGGKWGKWRKKGASAVGDVEAMMAVQVDGNHPSPATAVTTTTPPVPHNLETYTRILPNPKPAMPPPPKPPRKGKPWTEGEDETLLHMWFQMEGDGKIAPVLGRTVVAVRRRRQVLMGPEARRPMREVYERVSRRYMGGGMLGVVEEEEMEGMDEG
ncbi:hypothetical protein BCR34DRAFT_667011 [Clohesyomyces aquaticus]|uniref:Myb-like domain-containing protein n=1 Tax=Clohesyomyces aquaticus TaxID=1231657 RepID=A0A1Y1Z3F6_9PLEO|nr:hypothetical protein BCR34DRAFT_667011 [Clohesyomyces aquaticus]